MPSAKTNYRFTFGPWNISQGADPFGPPVRAEVAFAAKIREYKKLGFDGVQFHDDDAVSPDQIDVLSPQELRKAAASVKLRTWVNAGSVSTRIRVGISPNHTRTRASTS